ncbi:hypothetical protein PR048_005506 [Dryococelus australis]|uniref:Uncharacterized protein n=1 Tax=Dryococelus australis TaxID=614101 RepID=A0ABQ9I8G3_9NEOP|nr:hypothetical protein PR048_005506 [Dryococelus australis]
MRLESCSPLYTSYGNVIPRLLTLLGATLHSGFGHGVHRHRAHLKAVGISGATYPSFPSNGCCVYRSPRPNVDRSSVALWLIRLRWNKWTQGIRGSQGHINESFDLLQCVPNLNEVVAFSTVHSDFDNVQNILENLIETYYYTQYFENDKLFLEDTSTNKVSIGVKSDTPLSLLEFDSTMIRQEYGIAAKIEQYDLISHAYCRYRNFPLDFVHPIYSFQLNSELDSLLGGIDDFNKWFACIMPNGKLILSLFNKMDGGILNPINAIPHTASSLWMDVAFFKLLNTYYTDELETCFKANTSHHTARVAMLVGIAYESDAAWLGCSPPTKANRVRSPAEQLPNFRNRVFVKDDTAGRRIFSAISRFPGLCNFGAAPYSPDITLIGSQGHCSLEPPKYLHSTMPFSDLQQLATEICLKTKPHGFMVAEWLACLPPIKAIRVQSPAGSLQIFAYMLVGGFSRRSPVSPILLIRRCSIPTSINFIGSQDLDAILDKIQQPWLVHQKSKQFNYSPIGMKTIKFRSQPTLITYNTSSGSHLPRPTLCDQLISRESVRQPRWSIDIMGTMQVSTRNCMRDPAGLLRWSLTHPSLSASVLCHPFDLTRPARCPSCRSTTWASLQILEMLVDRVASAGSDITNAATRWTHFNIHCTYVTKYHRIPTGMTVPRQATTVEIGRVHSSDRHARILLCVVSSERPAQSMSATFGEEEEKRIPRYLTKIPCDSRNFPGQWNSDESTTTTVFQWSPGGGWGGLKTIETDSFEMGDPSQNHDRLSNPICNNHEKMTNALHTNPSSNSVSLMDCSTCPSSPNFKFCTTNPKLSLLSSSVPSPIVYIELANGDIRKLDSFLSGRSGCDREVEKYAVSIGKDASMYEELCTQTDQQDTVIEYLEVVHVVLQELT